ncbi:MAG: hypothetical protein JW717_12150 [Marinilabiliaceae bacterium]|nr:hypothetical protein [Marinilabiliaceae bacterium]
MSNLGKHTALRLYYGLLALLIFISTSGFTIYTHTCLTSHTSLVSFFVPVTHCEHEDDICHSQLSYGEVSESSCCSVNNFSNDTKCCFDYREYKKLDTVTLLSNAVIQIVPVNCIVLNLLFSSMPLLCDVNSNLIYCFNENPPLIFSTDVYLAKIQVYLI